MFTEKMTKQMIDLQKSTFDMMLNTMSNIQEQSGRATQAWFEQVAGLPQENLKSMNNWMDAMRESRNQFNSAVQEGFKNYGNVVEQTMRQTEESARQFQRSAQQQE